MARFTYQGREYKKSPKTKGTDDARAALRDVENRIHSLIRGVISVPDGVDAGDFIVWGNSAKRPVAVRKSITFRQLAEQYLKAQGGFKADSTVTTERIDLDNAAACLGAAADQLVDRLAHCDLERVLRERLRTDTAGPDAVGVWSEVGHRIRLGLQDSVATWTNQGSPPAASVRRIHFRY